MLWPIYCFIKKWSFFVKSTYGSNGSFFYFETFLTNANHGQYGLTRIIHFNQFLSKTDTSRFALYLHKSSVNFYQETIPFERSCPFKDSVKSSFLCPWWIIDKFLLWNNTVWPILSCYVNLIQLYKEMLWMKLLFWTCLANSD